MKSIIFLNLFLIPCLLFASNDKVFCRGKNKDGDDIVKSYSSLAFRLARDSFYTHSVAKIRKNDKKEYMMKLLGNNCFCSSDVYDRNNPKAQTKYNTIFTFSAGEIICKELMNSDKLLNDRFLQGDINIIVNNASDLLTSVCAVVCKKALDKQKTGKYLCKINDTIGKNDWSCEKR